MQHIPTVRDGRDFSSWVNALNQRGPVHATLELCHADPMRCEVDVSVCAGGVELECRVVAGWGAPDNRVWFIGDEYDIRADPGAHLGAFVQVPLEMHGVRDVLAGVQKKKRRRLRGKQPPPQD